MTDMTILQQKMAELSCHFQYKINEPMHKHTSLRIGGNAEIFACPQCVEELAEVLQCAASLGVKPVILGAGTNVLVPDAGLKGIVICLKDCFDGMELVDETRIRIFSGVTMTRAAVFASNHGLTGMEFAHGIPGTVGGGVFMNAGAYGGEMQQIVESVQIMDFAGNLTTLTNAEMGFSYRHSRLEESGEIVVSAVFRLEKGERETIRETMRQLQAKRSASQPLDLPSAGSAFKRPVGGYAAALIDQAGLKGFQVGGAAISTKHAGFAVNLGDATAADMKALLQQVSDIVFAQSGIRLEPEVRIW